MVRPTKRVLIQLEKRRELNRCKRDLRHLAAKLGYDWDPSAQQGVTDHFHGPTCDRMDHLESHPKVAIFAPRKSLKSTLYSIVWSVQQILINPDITIAVFHAVEAEANKIVQEVGEIFRTNEYIRGLDPIGIYPAKHKRAGQSFNVCPHINHKKWISNSPSTHFSITLRPKMNPTTRRQFTMMAKGAGSETTGVHVDIIILDDIIGLQTLEDSTGMAKIGRWYRVTVISVLNNNGRIRLVGTRYDEADFYGTHIINNEDWDVTIRSARETNGKMDWKGRAVVWGASPRKDGKMSDRMGQVLAEKRERSALRDQGQSDYAAQRMNDPTPAGSIPWVRTNEQFTTLKGTDEAPGAAGPGVTFVMFDPAPRAGAAGDGSKEKQRGDGSKDWGSIAVVKYRAIGAKQCLFLLDGIRSLDWNRTDGIEACRTMMAKWRTPFVFIENYTGGSGDYTNEMRILCNQAGTPLFLEKGLLPKFNQSYAHKAKTTRFESLAAKNDRQEFYVVTDTCSEEYLYGDGEYTGFLTQIRKLRPLPGGRNNLRWDDDADIVSRGTDSKLTTIAPIPDPLEEWQRALQLANQRNRKLNSRVRHMIL